MSKLFAMENDEVVEAAVTPGADEVAVVTDAAIETTEEVAGTEQVAENIDAGVDAAEDLGNVEEVLTEAVEGGEGLSPVAAESVRIAVEAICRNIGADAKRVYPLYATENFSAASSRMANTKLALEGVAEFAKDVYKRIKAALENLWKKVKAFWDKHISTLGQVKKAVESLKKKVKAAKELKGAPFFDAAPSGLISAFKPAGELNAAAVKTTLANHKAFAESCGKYLTTSASATAKLSAAEMAAKVSKNAAAVQQAGLVGDMTVAVKIAEEEGKLSFEITREAAEKNAENKGMVAASKAEMDAILATVTELVDSSIAARKGYDAAQKTKAADLAKLYADAEAAGGKADVDHMRLVYKASVFDGRVSNLVSAENIRAAKAGMGFVAACLTRYN